jgi:hypothetical protein
MIFVNALNAVQVKDTAASGLVTLNREYPERLRAYRIFFAEIFKSESPASWGRLRRLCGPVEAAFSAIDQRRILPLTRYPRYPNGYNIAAARLECKVFSRSRPIHHKITYLVTATSAMRNSRCEDRLGRGKHTFSRLGNFS